MNMHENQRLCIVLCLKRPSCRFSKGPWARVFGEGSLAGVSRQGYLGRGIKGRVLGLWYLGSGLRARVFGEGL